MKKHFSFFVILLAFLAVKGKAQNTDTVIDGRHYNTVIKYHNFDYKGQQELSYITAYGNMANSVKDGRWMYVLPDGYVLATGNFDKGYKCGRWKYRGSDGRYFITTWKKSDRVKDYVYFEDNVNPQLIDYLSMTSVKWHNGRSAAGIRFL